MQHCFGREMREEWDVYSRYFHVLGVGAKEVWGLLLLMPAVLAFDLLPRGL